MEEPRPSNTDDKTDNTHSVNKVESSGTENHKDEITAILSDLGIALDDPIATAWLVIPKERGLHTLAHRSALGVPRAVDEEFMQYIDQFESVLDRVLEKFELRYADSLMVLDVLASKQTPTKTDVEAVKQYLPNNLIAQDHFFRQLQSGAWIAPLRRKGYFGRPPAPESLAEGGQLVTRHNLWPPSRYLARMARSERYQNAVLEAAKVIPPTANSFVQEDLVSIALSLPPTLAVQVTTTLVESFKAEQHDVLIDDVERLVIGLAEGGQAADASRIAKQVLSLAPGTKMVFPAWNGAEERSLPPDPESWLDDQSYGKFLSSVVRALVAGSGLDAVRMLCDLLNSAVEINVDPDRDGPSHDYSEVWRPRVETDAEAWLAEERDYLISAIRDSAEEMVRSNPVEVLPRVLELLAGYRWDVFRRLELHLIRRFREDDPEAARSRLVDRAMFDSLVVRHEYDLLASDHYDALALKDQELLLGWIDDGPDVTTVREVYESRFGVSLAPEDERGYVDRWRYARLDPIRDNLPPDWRQKYEELASIYGVREGPDEPHLSNGHLSPRSEDELSSMDPGDLAAYLRDWEPEAGTEADKVGLAWTLVRVVQKDPHKSRDLLDASDHLESSYTLAVLEGLHEAVREGTEVPWDEVLVSIDTFLRSVLDQRERAGEGGGIDEPSASRMRREIAQLVKDALERAVIPISLRAAVWEVLEPLTRAPSPNSGDPDETQRLDGAPDGLLFTTASPIAIAASLSYARWVYVAHVMNSGKGYTGWEGFDSVPEVRDSLEQLLSPGTDAKLNVWASLGALFPDLVMLDATWVTKHIHQVFPRESDHEARREAAWSSFVTRTEPDASTYEMLHDDYLWAIQRMSGQEEDSSGASSQENRYLGSHLLTLYQNGALGEEGLQDAIGPYFALAGPDAKARVLEDVARRITSDGVRAPGGVERLRTLLEARLGAAEYEKVAGGLGDATRAEVEQLGGWIASGVFDTEWSLEQLKRLIEITNRVAPRFRVIKWLASVSGTHPDAAVRLLELLEDCDPVDPYVLSAWSDELHIVALGHKSEAAETRSTAERVARKMVAHGHLGFRQFLLP